MIKSIKQFSKKTLLLMGAYVVFKWAVILGAGSYLYTHGLWRNEYFLVFPAIAAIVLTVKLKKKKNDPKNPG